MKTIRQTIDGRTYYIAISGVGSPILLLHGFTGDTTIWQDVRQTLDISYQMIAIDILGHGKSDKPTDVTAYQMENVAHDIVEILKALAIDNAHLLGYSMGGRLALYLAIHFPYMFHSLILESASPGLQSQQEREERHIHDNALADKIESHGIEWFVDYWESLSLWDSQKSLPQSVLDKQRQQRLNNIPHGLANSLRGMGTGVQPSLWDDLSNLSLPTLLMAGEHDQKFRNINSEMASQIISAKMRLISNAGHRIHLENPTTFVGQIRSFLHSI